MYTALTSTEASGVQPDTLPPTQPMEQDHSMSHPDPNSSSEPTAAAQQPSSPPPASTRGAPPTHARPTSLQVSLPLASVSPAAAIQQGGDDQFPSSEEEQTPDGGRREFVGHPYHYTLINNGEAVVTPERPMIPPNTVFGCDSALNAYRRQFSENNAQYHSYIRQCERLQSEAQTQHMLRRQLSEPPYHGTEARRDNNRQIIREEHNVPVSRT